MTYQPNNTHGPFLSSSDFFPLDADQLKVKLTDMYSRISSSVNVKEIAIYDLNEIVTGQQFYNQQDFQTPKIGFRKVFPFRAIVSGATLLIPHGITGMTMFTRIYGTAQNTLGWYPIPYASNANLGFQIDIRLDNTNIIIVNGVAGVSLPIISGNIVLEYLKN